MPLKKHKVVPTLKIQHKSAFSLLHGFAIKQSKMNSKWLHESESKC